MVNVILLMHGRTVGGCVTLGIIPGAPHGRIPPQKRGEGKFRPAEEARSKIRVGFQFQHVWRRSKRSVVQSMQHFSFE